MPPRHFAVECAEQLKNHKILKDNCYCILTYFRYIHVPRISKLLFIAFSLSVTKIGVGSLYFGNASEPKSREAIRSNKDDGIVLDPVSEQPFQII